MLVGYLILNSMYYFDGVIIVEGINDESYLSSFIKSEYIVTNGYEIPKSIVDYLTHIKNRQILVLTDPDSAGRNIELKIKNINLQCIYLCVDITKCNKNKKHGIAECEKDEILRVMSSYLTKKNPFVETFSRKDFVDCGFLNKELREKAQTLLCLGESNSKTFFKRLNFNKYKKADIVNLWK